eukprot:284819563_5
MRTSCQPRASCHISRKYFTSHPANSRASINATPLEERVKELADKRIGMQALRNLSLEYPVPLLALKARTPLFANYAREKDNSWKHWRNCTIGALFFENTRPWSKFSSVAQLSIDPLETQKHPVLEEGHTIAQDLDIQGFGIFVISCCANCSSTNTKYVLTKTHQKRSHFKTKCTGLQQLLHCFPRYSRYSFANAVVLVQLPHKASGSQAISYTAIRCFQKDHISMTQCNILCQAHMLKRAKLNLSKIAYSFALRGDDNFSKRFSNFPYSNLSSVGTILVYCAVLAAIESSIYRLLPVHYVPGTLHCDDTPF